MRLVINVFQIIFFWIWTLISAVCGFIILPFLGQKKAIYNSSRLWSFPLLWIAGVKIDVIGLKNVNVNKPMIYASNHESSLDIPLMFAVMPIPLFFLAKSELRKIPVFGWFVHAVGMVFIDRTNHDSAMKSLQKAGDEISKGKNIISFPEGTRPRDGKMKMFKRGTFILALENDISVVPIAIIGSKEVNPPGYKITRGTITVRIGKPIESSKFEKNKPDAFAKEVEDKVREMRIL